MARLRGDWPHAVTGGEPQTTPPFRPLTPLTKHLLALALRLMVGIALGWCVSVALVAPEIPLAPKGAALLVLGLALWQPAMSLVATVAVVPFGLLLAPIPASASELITWAFLCGWLVGVWRPLAAVAPPRNRLPASFATGVALYTACLAASWLGLAIAGAAGVQSSALAGFILRSLPVDHLIFSSPEPEAWTFLHAITGIALLAAALVLSRADTRVTRWIAATLAGVAAVLSVLTMAEVAREWANTGYGTWHLMRYVQGERFTLHLSDLNAAGSHYVLAGLIALAFAMDGRRRWLWVAAIVVMLPALWLTGSRSAAIGGIVVGALALLFSRPPSAVWRGLRSRPAAIAIACAAVAVLAVGLVSSRGTAGERGSARMSLEYRNQFLVTSARMFASAPVFGVGVGQYLPRSAEFMPQQLHAVYPFENAHNYFAQQFAELGLVGGIAFAGLVVAGLRLGWRAVRTGSADAAVKGLFAGTAGYLLTCATGHPLLVPEAALPFWAAFGALAGAADGPWRSRRRCPAIALAAVLLLASVGIKADARRVPSRPLDRGLHDQQVATDGTRFRWSTRHAVTWVAPGAGFLTIPVRAPDVLRRRRPFSVQIEVDGVVWKRTEVAADRWTRIGLSLRRHANGAVRRVDVRVNQVWTAKRDRGDPGNTDDRPMGIMVGDMKLETPDTRK